MQAPRMSPGDLSVGFVHAIDRALGELGIPAGELLQRFDLGSDRLARAGARLSIPHYMRLGHAAITLSGRAELGLLMGRHSHLQQLGLAGACAALAPDIRAAMRCLTGFEPLYASNYLGQSSLQEDASGAWISFYSIAPYNDYNRFVVDAVLKGWHSQMQQIAGREIELERVQIEYPAPPHARLIEEAFACPVEFSATANRLRMRREMLALPNPLHCAHSWLELLELCRQQLKLLQTPTSLSGQVSRLMAALLRLGEPRLEDIAHQLHMPGWTLQRRLEEEGTGFRQLLQEVRHGLAISYLRDTLLTVAEVAWLLGFSSSEAFQRAFRRWQGQTPGQFRRQCRQAANP